MNVLVTALGTSPMVVTEMIDELKKLGKSISKVITLTTKDDRVDISYYILALDFKWIYNDSIKLERIELPFNDIKSQEDHDNFVKIARDVIKREIEAGNHVIVSVAGGRKTMSVGLYKAGLEAGAKEFYHIIAEEIVNPRSDLISIAGNYDLKAIYEGKVKPPEELKNKIMWELHRTDLTLHLIKI